MERRIVVEIEKSIIFILIIEQNNKGKKRYSLDIAFLLWCLSIHNLKNNDF